MENTSVLFDVQVTSTEAAAVWGVHRGTVNRWVASGHAKPLRKLPGAHGSYMFTGAEVLRVAAAPRPKIGRPFGRKSVAA